MKTPNIQHGQCVWANGVGDELFAGRVALPPRVKKKSRKRESWEAKARHLSAAADDD